MGIISKTDWSFLTEYNLADAEFAASQSPDSNAAAVETSTTGTLFVKVQLDRELLSDIEIQQAKTVSVEIQGIYNLPQEWVNPPEGLSSLVMWSF